VADQDFRIDTFIVLDRIMDNDYIYIFAYAGSHDRID
jgi:hypothetical protein